MSGGLFGAPLISGVGPFELPESIELTTDPDKMTYNDGEEIDLTGAVVQGKNADGTDWHPPRFIRWKNDQESVYKKQAEKGIGVCDLNNWDKRGMPGSLSITYNSAAIENTFTYTMQDGQYERMYYPLQVEPNTTYLFSLFIGGEFEEGKNSSGCLTHVGVCRYMLPNEYIEHMSTDSPAIIADRHFSSTYYDNPAETFMEFTTDSNTTVVFLFIDFAAITNGDTVSFRIMHIQCRPAGEDSILWAKKPMEINSPDEESYNYMAVSPGAWAYSIVDALRRHHLFMLSGNEFKVRILTSRLHDGDYELSGQRELHSEPVVVGGKTYHAVHYFLSNYYTVSLFFVNQYRAKMPSDDAIYETLSRYVTSAQPYDHYKLYTKKDLYRYLGVNDGNSTESEIDDLLDGYIVDKQ